MEAVNGHLKDIFNTILRDQANGGSPLPPIIVLHGNGNVIAPGGTIYMQRPEQADSAPTQEN